MQTAFGSPLGAPHESAGVLRAVAARAGLTLRTASEVDLVAAVVGADIWVRLAGMTDLGRAGSAGAGPAEAASRILARAAGYGDNGREWLTGPGQGSELALTMLEHYWAWADEHLGTDGARWALWRAGHDLVGGGERYAEAGWALQLFADDMGPRRPKSR